MYLGLDLGTTAIKGVLIDDSQNIVAAATRIVATELGSNGWAEQNPSNWIGAAVQVFGELRSSAPSAFRKTQAISLSGQMHTLVALDETHKPLRPAILWNDTRGAEWCESVLEAGIPLSLVTGVRPMSSFTAAKLGWLRQNERDTFDRIRHVLLPKDFVRLWLTGEVATDPSDAGGTQLFDQRQRRWSEDVFAVLDLPISVMPPVIEGSTVAGSLREAIASDLGLGSIPIICGGGDAATGSLGAGCVDAKASMISLGTGAIYLSMHDSYAPVMIDTIHNFAHCLSDKWYHMAALLTCGSAIAWACSITGITTQMAMAELETRQHEPSNVVFLPYLDGVRTPHGNSQARGVFLGLDRAVSGIDLIQAVVEGVTFALADAGQALSSEGDTDASPLLLGGGAKSLYWAKLIATVLGRPVRRAVDAEAGSALGAARLAMIGSGVGSVQEVCYSPHSEAIDPISNLSEQYRQRLQEFRSMYFASETFSRFPRS